MPVCEDLVALIDDDGHYEGLQKELSSEDESSSPHLHVHFALEASLNTPMQNLSLSCSSLVTSPPVTYLFPR